MNSEDLLKLPDLGIFPVLGEGVENRPLNEKERRDLGIGTTSASRSVDSTMCDLSSSKISALAGLLMSFVGESDMPLESSDDWVLMEPPSVKVGTSLMLGTTVLCISLCNTVLEDDRFPEDLSDRTLRVRLRKKGCQSWWETSFPAIGSSSSCGCASSSRLLSGVPELCRPSVGS